MDRSSSTIQARKSTLATRLRSYPKYQVWIVIFVLAALTYKIIFPSYVTSKTTNKQTQTNERPLTHCVVHDFTQVIDTSDPKQFECVHTRGDVPDILICLYPDENDVIISKAIRKAGAFEPRLSRMIANAMKRYPQSKFLDIGANIGMHTLSLAKLGYDVIAVEPKWSTIQRLHKGVNLNHLSNKITLLTMGLSDVRETLTLHSSAAHPGGSSIQPGHPRVKNLTDTIKTVFMDDLLEVIAAGQELVVKMDIEGSESHALARSTEFFDALNVHVIIMEWMSMRLNLQQGVDTDLIHNMIQSLRSRGFEARALDETFKFEPTKFPPLHDEDMLNWPVDIVWIKPDAIVGSH